MPRLHFEHHCFHLIADLDHLVRMLHPPAPGHLRNVDQPLDPGLDFDESPVVGDTHDSADDAALRRVAVRERFPRVRIQLPHAERDALPLTVELQNLDGDLIARMQHLRWMRDPPVRNIADVQQSIDPAQVDERAVFGEILHRPGDHRAFEQIFQRAVPPRFHLIFDGQLARYDDVAAASIQLDDLDRNILPDELIQIVNRPHVHLRSRHERGHAYIYRQAAFSPFQYPAGDEELIAHRLIQRVPDPQTACPRIREEDVAFRLMTMSIHDDIDRVACFYRN
jgi:hypothetical protein